MFCLSHHFTISPYILQCCKGQQPCGIYLENLSYKCEALIPNLHHGLLWRAVDLYTCFSAIRLDSHCSMDGGWGSMLVNVCYMHRETDYRTARFKMSIKRVKTWYCLRRYWRCRVYEEDLGFAVKREVALSIYRIAFAKIKKNTWARGRSLLCSSCRLEVAHANRFINCGSNQLGRITINHTKGYHDELNFDKDPNRDESWRATVRNMRLELLG